MKKIYWNIWWWVRDNIMPYSWQWAVELDEPGHWQNFTALDRNSAERRARKILGKSEDEVYVARGNDF